MTKIMGYEGDTPVEVYFGHGYEIRYLFDTMVRKCGYTDRVEIEKPYYLRKNWYGLVINHVLEDVLIISKDAVLDIAAGRNPEFNNMIVGKSYFTDDLKDW